MSLFFFSLLIFFFVDFTYSTNNFFSPIDPASTDDRIIQNGYPAERYQIQTSDGYILSVFRIPKGKRSLTWNAKPVLIMHGILCSSDCWVINDPGQGLAYVLADAGYDVWIGNSRGNTYCRSHINMTSADPRFWNFSFHEIGYYDLPAIIDYMLANTGANQITYIGHSQGTSVFFVMASSRPDYNKKIRVMAAMAPVAYMNYTKGVFDVMGKVSAWLIVFARLLHLHHVLDHSLIIETLDRTVCRLNWEICNDVISLIGGFDTKHLNKTLIHQLGGITPTGASIKQLEHFGQLLHNGGQFTWYDYGKKNMEIYHSGKPPEYNLSQITASIAIFYGPNDFISSVREVKLLSSRLKNVRSIMKIDDFNHLDFMWAFDVNNLLYKHLIKVLNNYY